MSIITFTFDTVDARLAAAALNDQARNRVGKQSVEEMFEAYLDDVADSLSAHIRGELESQGARAVKRALKVGHVYFNSIEAYPTMLYFLMLTAPAPQTRELIKADAWPCRIVVGAPKWITHAMIMTYNIIAPESFLKGKGEK